MVSAKTKKPKFLSYTSGVASINLQSLFSHSWVNFLNIFGQIGTKQVHMTPVNTYSTIRTALRYPTGKPHRREIVAGYSVFLPNG